MAVDETLRGDTVAETIENICHRYFGDTVEVPKDVISALLVLASQIGGSAQIDESNTQVVPTTEIDSLIEGGVQ